MMIRVQGAAEVQNGIYYEYDNESQPLGQGGMGIVYEGYCFRVNNHNEYIPVAIKKITNTTPDLIERAMREASIQIDHPNLLRMWGFIPNMEMDPYTNTRRTQYYVVMDRLVGVDLYSLMTGVTIDKSGFNIEYAQELYSLSLTDRLEFTRVIMTNVLDAIAALHQAGYIHRDIDPSNVMITNEREIKLIDFGISKTFSSLNDNGHKLTKTGSIIGKSDYAAPEIVTGDVLHHNVTTDIYALGILLYQLYMGTLPFVGSDAEVMQAQLNNPVPVENIDNELIRNVVKRATQKKQAYRYQSVEEMKGFFDNIFSDASKSSRAYNDVDQSSDSCMRKGKTHVDDSFEASENQRENEQSQEDSHVVIQPHFKDEGLTSPWIWVAVSVIGVCLGVVSCLLLF